MEDEKLITRSCSYKPWHLERMQKDANELMEGNLSQWQRHIVEEFYKMKDKKK